MCKLHQQQRHVTAQKERDEENEQNARMAAYEAARTNQRAELIDLALQLCDLGAPGARRMKASKESLGSKHVKAWRVGSQRITSPDGNFGDRNQRSSWDREIYLTVDGRFAVENGHFRLTQVKGQQVTESARSYDGTSRSALDLESAITQLRRLL